MKTRTLFFPLFLLYLFTGSVSGALLESGTPQRFNALTEGTPLGSTNPQPATQFSGLNVTSAAATATGANARFQLNRVRVGNAFAGTVPRYFLGDRILAPATLSSNTTVALASGFWRAKPVRPGEVFTNPDGSPLVDTQGNPLPSVSLGASSGIPIPSLADGSFEAYYYSNHANAVFASRPGPVEIWWVSASPQGPNGGAWKFRRESFTVSSASSVPVRLVYWTEKSFDGPRVTIPTGRIERVNPIYTSAFPSQVAAEYQPPGFLQNPNPNAQFPDENRTLWVDAISGNIQLAAYNLEGRVIIEYLGPEIAPGRHEFLGADVVEVRRAASAQTLDVDLGQLVLPRDQDRNLIPSPSFNLASNDNSYYYRNTLSDGSTVYYAERENLNPDRVIFYWLSVQDAGVHLLGADSNPGLRIEWPKYKDRYRFIWPDSHSAYAYYTTDPTGSTVSNGIEFNLSSLPSLVWQDDRNQTEARFDSSSQRFVIEFDGDKANRALLRFVNGSKLWYQLIYSQADDRFAYIEPDQGDALTANLLVGSRIERPSVQYELAGAITAGRNYLASAYRDPFALGVTAAAAGAIIPVNAKPGENTITVRWFQKVYPPNDSFQPFYIPSKVGRYTVQYPSPAAGEDRVVMASNLGTENLTAAQAAGSLYFQNDPAAIGYNPNEEHALKKSSKFWALRDDLNVTFGAGYTSEPFLLLHYTDPDDQRPAMRIFRVVREDPTAGYSFQYPWTAGTLLQGPMPLPLMNLPMRNEQIANTEVVDGNPDPAVANTAPATYDTFTFEDRKGYKWVYRGPHAGGTPGFGMQWYYLMEPEFYVPGGQSQPAAGTVLPYLRPLDDNHQPQGDPVTGTALTVHYLPTWPSDVPVMRIGETLTEAKYGLPDVRNQKSAAVLYQQSIAQGGSSKESVILSDPTRQKQAPLKASGLESKPRAADDKIPDVIRTSNYQGKTYFQDLPPHLQTRFFYDPLIDTNGGLVLQGLFEPAIAGEDSIELNTLSAQDIQYLKDLAINADATQQTRWATLIDGLSTRLETFEEDPARKGIFIVSQQAHPPVHHAVDSLPKVPDSDTARDSYALSATGQGAGYVTLVHGNGKNPDFTPVGDPVALEIIRVVPELYNGDLKTRFSSNPLDEQVSLRHSSDFAALPENFDFDWRWAPPTASGMEPATYNLSSQIHVGAPDNQGTRGWFLQQNPSSARPSPTSYANSVTYLPNAQTINASGYNASAGLPGLIARTQFPVMGFENGVPANLIFSADLPTHAGFVLYVNGVVAEVYGNGLPALAAFASPNDYTVRLDTLDNSGSLPVQGARLIVIAKIEDKLYFRIFDPTGQMVVDLAEENLSDKVSAIGDLKSRLSGLWSNTNLSESDQRMSANKVAPIVNFDLTPKPATGLSPNGLPLQFALNERYFTTGNNILEVALYSSSDSGASSANIDFRLEGSTRSDAVLAAGSPWTQATGLPALNNRAVVGGAPTAPLGSPLLVMSDNYFTMRYRAKATLPDGGSNPAYALTGGAWSQWTRPALVEGWIKRVLAGINPFNQRTRDLFNNAINTDVSLLTQAGPRWEGNIALTLDAINDYGLIEIYETLLNRARSISIDSGYNYAPANDALLLAAGYLNDLYSILGNEAHADAANPTISIEGGDSALEINTSRFSFEGQVASVLEEELALLRGRDDFLSPQVTQSPFYNRLFWNYTRGVDSGEVLYATNYNIQEKVGSSTEDGVIDAADAQRMFPQGHGDSYGHYLTALKVYYQLLLSPNFTWTPRTESLNILGNTVAVDYQDERKFAKAAANVARTGRQIIDLTWRQQYKESSGSGWSQFRDGKSNPQTGNTRHWGLDAWISRATQGSYYHWAIGNSLIPDVDAVNTGIQKIDRSTVLELKLLPASADSFQTTADNASAGLNPLGLSPEAVAFDIDPARLKAGESHFEQIYDRALTAVLNAKGAFDQAGTMTRLLRNQQNTINDFNTTLQDQERAFNYQLIDLYGTPYSGDIGSGRTYLQNYNGPDLNNWFVIDRPQGLPFYSDYNYSQGLAEVVNYGYAGDASLQELNLDAFTDSSATNAYTVFVRRDAFTQFSDEYWGQGFVAGSRRQIGKIQLALADTISTWLQVDAAIGNYFAKKALVNNKFVVINAEIKAEAASLNKLKQTNKEKNALQSAIVGLQAADYASEAGIQWVSELGETIVEAFPNVVGLSNDPSPAARATTKLTASKTAAVLRGIQVGLKTTISALDKELTNLDEKLAEAVGENQLQARKQQLYFEYIELWRDLYNTQYTIATLTEEHESQLNELTNLIAEGDRIQQEREIFRKRAAALVQGYRTTDLTFRAFRNEALEQYRSLFDLAARYIFLAAKSYDYETGLLGTSAGRAEIERIVSSRALGDLTGGRPQTTVSTLGDSGLAGTLAKLQSDFSVAKGRLGINNPDTNGTLFSLRQELFRLLKDASRTDDDRAWRQTLEQHMVSDLMADPDLAAHCMNLRKPDGSAVPGIVIPFSTTIEIGKNFFGLPLAGGDHKYSTSKFATKVYSTGVLFEGYRGMDPYIGLNPGTTTPDTSDPNLLSATPYIYLIPLGSDRMRAPALGDTGAIRTWQVHDQALPLPFNIGANDFSDTQFFSSDGTLREQPWILRKHPAFRPVDDPAFFYGLQPREFSNSRLIGRSVWNTKWKLVIPAYELLANEQEGLNRFAATVTDIKLFLRTYSNSGN